MELTPLYKRVIGLDVHQAKITACAIIEHENGQVDVIPREFGAFKRDRRALAEWVHEMAPEVVVMESTGVFWESPYTALEKAGIEAWVGICPGNNESAGKRKSGRIRRGNPWVRRLLCEFAQAAARMRCGLKAKFESLMIRKGYKKAIVALARKMLRILYAMLSNKAHYQDRTIDYEAPTVARNAPRWLKMLRKHGFISDAATAQPAFPRGKSVSSDRVVTGQGFVCASGWVLPH